MIEYDGAHRAFILTGKRFSYIMFVNRAGFLQTVHYGMPADGDGYLFSDRYAGNKSPDPNDFNVDAQQDGMPCEYACFGHGDYRAPSAVIIGGDGFRASRFVYKSHKIYKGSPSVDGMPHIRRGGETLAITLADELSTAEIKLNYTVFDDSDVLVRNAEIRNAGKTAVDLARAYSFCTEFADADFSIMRLAGRWAAERTPITTEIDYGTVRIESARGASSHQMNPFAALIRRHTTETAGECYGFNLLYSGSFAILAEKSQYGMLRVQGGINDFDFGWKLNGGETFVTPQAALCYSRCGLGEMSREYADFFRNYIIDPKKVNAHRPIVLNNWEATYFDFDTNKLFGIIDEAANLGVDTFVLDDGWFGRRDDDKSSLGDWFVNTEKLRGGLKAVSEKCKSVGLKFGLWLEPEMISEDSELFRAHPDYAMTKSGVTPCRSRNQLVLDFTRKDVVDHIFNAVKSVLESCRIDYVKWDFNRCLTEFYSASLPCDRQGEVAHRYMLGVYDLADRLTGAFPHIFFEGCAGGGGRFDGGMLYYFPQIWTSDDTDAYERTKIQWGTSMCYPISAMSCHVSACPNHQTQRITPFATRGVIASLGATGYELDPTALTDEEKAAVRAQVSDYLDIEDIVLGGDLYRLCDPFTDNYFCEMLVSKDKSRAYIVGERHRGVPCDLDNVVKLVGLDRNGTYKIHELGITASGKTLEAIGVLLPRLPDYGGFRWVLEKIN